MRHGVLVILSLAVLCAPLHAQDASRLQPGDRIRVTAPQAFRTPVTGTVAETAPDVLTLARGGGAVDTVNIPMALVRKVEVSRGHLSRGHGVRRGAVQGLAAGVVVGALVGGILGVGVDAREGENVNEVSESLTSAAQFGAIGLVAGGLMGMRERERWERLALPDVSVGMQGRSQVLTFSLRI
ncbi:MAG TPA: hypothetical protein VEQ60_01230 [Longimicrobium sp.]|nr:hypothetical protein [Longimicrobium sp.]